MRELRIVERYGQVVVTTSDGRRTTGATLSSALTKMFGEQDWTRLQVSFLRIEPKPDPGQIVEGQAGA